MPKTHNYTPGSLIFCKGEEANRVFILKSGKVNLIYTDIETNADMCDVVQQGEFFGLRSLIGHFPYEENAVSLTDSVVMALTLPEFESLAMSNARITLKMLKVFSGQLRRIHAFFTKLSGKELTSPDEELFNIGERCFKLKRGDHAKYIYSRYLAYYPTGKKASLAAKRLQSLGR
ncbi:MAG: cyclic nucleotide-binding domain-containing protein [Treponema sp.]|nr:cyclic nucleotide-binding domain-containing protein [Treponema sp.]